MRKILIVLILLCGHLHALDKDSTLKIYHKLFFTLSSKTVVSVYINDKEYQQVFLASKRIKLVKEVIHADIVLITNQRTLDSVLEEKRVIQVGKKPIIFATDYRFLKESSDIIGAIYWRKGRSQLLFIKNRLDRYTIVLPKEYKKFTIDEL